ncbi:MAG TPA: hypothetical protein PLU81_10905 [Deltaproteobacteria bacterium]|nr:hypothetical protein [Deltaproteobacteria bacterium]HPJ94714.1 hypothetical protein [Deltaproteobacteria bacterium]HPR52288.1 hypothetical protein [Deltaproteobacteria bacterium]
MKRCLFMVISAVFVLTPAVIQAEQKALLGTGNFAVKIDYMAFSGDFYDEIHDDDSAYVGIEGYGRIAPNIYFGGELGFGSVSSENIFSSILYGLLDAEHDEVTADFTFLELNAKYAKDLGRYFVFDAGGGLSLNNANVSFETYDWVDVGGTRISTLTAKREESQWLFGGQIFADLTFKFHWFMMGVNAKYQVTTDFEDSASGYKFSLNNWRFGMQLGGLF